MRIIQGKKSRDVYYYDEENMTIADKEGNTIKLYESLDGISEKNLVWDLDNFFHDFYELSNRFKLYCQVDKTNTMDWEELK